MSFMAFIHNFLCTLDTRGLYAMKNRYVLAGKSALKDMRDFKYFDLQLVAAQRIKRLALTKREGRQTNSGCSRRLLLCGCLMLEWHPWWALTVYFTLVIIPVNSSCALFRKLCIITNMSLQRWLIGRSCQVDEGVLYLLRDVLRRWWMGRAYEVSLGVDRETVKAMHKYWEWMERRRTKARS